MLAGMLAMAVCAGFAQSAPKVKSRYLPRADRSLLAHAQRAIVVITPGWDAPIGTLTRYERQGKEWQRVGDSVDVVVGKTGLGWDPAIAKKRVKVFSGPVKHEGDKRAPAGVFALTHTFGYAPSLAGASNYIPLTPSVECVDDPASRYYTRIVDRAKTPKVDWKSFEQMRREDDLYSWGVLVAYNTKKPVAGNGSCIFMHIWQGPDIGTVGCTAMAPANLKALVDWVGGPERAVLIQLPQHEYERVKQPWHLP